MSSLLSQRICNSDSVKRFDKRVIPCLVIRALLDRFLLILEWQQSDETVVLELNSSICKY